MSKTGKAKKTCQMKRGQKSVSCVISRIFGKSGKSKKSCQMAKSKQICLIRFDEFLQNEIKECTICIPS